MRGRIYDFNGRRLWSRRAVLKGGGALAGGVLTASCTSSSPPPGARDGGADMGGPKPDMGRTDMAGMETGPRPPDGGAPDTMTGMPDTMTGTPDTQQPPPDAGAPDATNPPPDAGAPDASPPDAEPVDTGPPPDPHPAAFPAPAWLRDARIGGMDSHLEPDVLAAQLDAYKAQGVSVIEFDGILSFHLDEAAFAEELAAIDVVAKAAHARGMKAVAYYPTLETLTPEVASKSSSMAKDHPDWLQVDITGKQNVFIGGVGRVFWVEPGTESAWTCPNSPYSEYFINRVKRLAGTALDGLWGDVPLLSDIIAVWPCVCNYCKAKFTADTGLTIPGSVNFDDATFRRWVIWRHKIIHDFEQRILQGVRQVRNDFEVIIETVSMDYSSCTAQGLDGASHDDGFVYRVWEVDVCSDRSSMRQATAEDWVDMACMMKFGADTSWPRPSWIFSYGIMPDDAEFVFATAVAMGNNPFELKVPMMTSSVGAAYRTKVFKWLESEPSFFQSYPWSQAAVFYSSPSRDFLDRNMGVGLFSSLNSSDDLWWATVSSDFAGGLPYVGDYRGWSKALFHAHVPFDILPSHRASAETFGKYRMVVLPSTVALSASQMTQLVAYVNNGGTLIASGSDLGRYDELGADRGSPALLTMLGATPTAEWSKRMVGKGTLIHGGTRLGQAFKKGESSRAVTEATQALTTPQLTTDAPGPVFFNIRRTRDGKVLLPILNLNGLGASRTTFAGTPVTFNASLWLDWRKVTAATLSRPGMGSMSIPFQMANGRVSFAASASTIALVTLTLG